MINFITKLEEFELFNSNIKYIEHLEKVFNISNVLNLFFKSDINGDEKDNSTTKTNFGIYPAEINNLFLINFKDCWIDPDNNELYTNIYLKKGISENYSFVYVNENEWNFIKNIFGYNFEILRKTAYISGNLLIEVNLKKIKILVLSNELREKNIDLIKPRNIQISKELTIKDLKNKILRCLKDYTNNKNEVDIYDLNLYLFGFALKDNKKTTFELIYAYKNKFKNFNLSAEEINDDFILIENFKYGPGDLLVVEVGKSEKFIKIIKEQKECNYCKQSFDTAIKCNYCDLYIYCSESCKKKDEIHISYHSKINKLYKQKFNFQELSEIKIQELLERGSKHGLVGLKNLGNTCFMNSALQCLSHCEELTKYFIMKTVFDEINRSNTLGTGGEVAKAYFELLKELWQGSSPYLGPTDFRQIFIRFVRQFAGFSQHDSHEMLTFMLDTLHEDLNRVKTKPYVEMNEKLDNENDQEASQRWWKNHLARDNSIIVDLFHGQYKSVITCPECSKISITYDPFMILGVPIPSGNLKIKIKFFPYKCESTSKNFIYEYEMPINDHTTVKDMKYKIMNSQTNLNYEYLEAVSLTKEKALKKIMKDEEFIYNYFDNSNEIVIYQKYPLKLSKSEFDNYVTFYVSPSELIEERSMLFMKNIYQKNLSYPIILSLEKNSNLNDVYFNVYLLLRRILLLNDKNYNLEKFLEQSHSNNIEYIQDEFKHYFPSIQEGPFKLLIINNVQEVVGIFSNTKPNCEFCGNKCEFCLLTNAVSSYKTSVQYLKSKQANNRPFLLYAEISKCSRNSKIFENLEFPILSNSKNLIIKQSQINIYDCINLFSSEERLEKDNAWYCSKCRKHQEAFKKLEIYRAPNYLIVQFKRFKIKTNNSVIGMITNKKNDALIDYPIEGLDLRDYVVGENKNNAVYDLVGINQHYGGLSSGHYTATCKNFDRWYEFDDEKVSRATDIVDSSAYMLFYRKRYLNSTY